MLSTFLAMADMRFSTTLCNFDPPLVIFKIHRIHRQFLGFAFVGCRPEQLDNVRCKDLKLDISWVVRVARLSLIGGVQC